MLPKTKWKPGRPGGKSMEKIMNKAKELGINTALDYIETVAFEMPLPAI